MTGHERGEVVWYPAMFAEYDRPFVLISGTAHPYHGEESIGLAITTTATDEAIPIAATDWALGTLPEESYVKPWNPVVLKDADVVSVAGALENEFVDRLVSELATICRR